MKIQILQEKLKEGLGIVEKVSLKSVTLPILNNVLLEIKKNFLKLSATDLEIGIRWWALAKTDKEGSLAVPSKLLSSFITLLPNKKIELSSKEDVLDVECEDCQTKIKGFSAEEFPLIPEVRKEEFVSVKASFFCRGLAQIADIPVLSSARPEISGVFFSFQKDSLSTAATDSFRLGEKKIPLSEKNNLAKPVSFILPQKTAKELINIFSDKEENLKIYFAPNQVMFELTMPETDHPQIQIVSRLIEGSYPNYKGIIPQKFSTRLTLNKDEFLNKIKAAALFSGKSNEIKISADPAQKQAEVLSQAADLGDHKSALACGAEGEKLEVTFNYRFLQDGISKIRGDEAILELNGDSGPGVLKDTKDSTYTYVVMPIKSS